MASMKVLLDVCDQETKDLVSGFVRNVQNIFSKENVDDPFYTISINIIHLCLSYYFIVEQFVNTGNKYIQLSNNNRTIRNTGYGWDTIYGALDIDCNVEMNYNKTFEWTFEIHDNSIRCAAIGIDTHHRKWVNEYFKTKDGTYSLKADGDAHRWEDDTQQEEDL